MIDALRFVICWQTRNKKRTFCFYQPLTMGNDVVSVVKVGSGVTSVDEFDGDNIVGLSSTLVGSFQTVDKLYSGVSSLIRRLSSRFCRRRSSFSLFSFSFVHRRR